MSLELLATTSPSGPGSWLCSLAGKEIVCTSALSKMSLRTRRGSWSRASNVSAHREMSSALMSEMVDRPSQEGESDCRSPRAVVEHQRSVIGEMSQGRVTGRRTTRPRGPVLGRRFRGRDRMWAVSAWVASSPRPTAGASRLRRERPSVSGRWAASREPRVVLRECGGSAAGCLRRV